MGFPTDGKNAREITEQRIVGTVLFTPPAPAISTEDIWEIKRPTPIEEYSSITYVEVNLGSIPFARTATETPNCTSGAKTVNVNGKQDPTRN